MLAEGKCDVPPSKYGINSACWDKFGLHNEPGELCNKIITLSGGPLLLNNRSANEDGIIIETAMGAGENEEDVDWVACGLPHYDPTLGGVTGRARSLLLLQYWKNTIELPGINPHKVHDPVRNILSVIEDVEGELCMRH
jgi:hypothetical protein